MKKLLFLISVTSFLFLSCSGEDNATTEDTQALEQTTALLLGKWKYVERGEVINGTEQEITDLGMYCDDPVSYLEFKAVEPDASIGRMPYIHAMCVDDELATYEEKIGMWNPVSADVVEIRFYSWAYNQPFQIKTLDTNNLKLYFDDGTNPVLYYKLVRM